LKHDPEIVLIDVGKEIDHCDEQYENAVDKVYPRFEIMLLDSIVKVDRRGQRPKRDFEMASIDEGIQIDSSDEQFSKSVSARIETREPRSKLKGFEPKLNVERCFH
jgi:hypothetical protein